MRKSALRKSALRMVKWRARHPMKCRFDWVRSSARKRGIAFLLTLEQFTSWAEEVGYLEHCGVRGYHCDRIDASKGYEAGNLRLLHYTANCSKGARSERGLRRPHEPR
ncbi:MAG: hypothetical protein JWO08_1180 [Verrucomicrobiaceae bacterium]|nr:hypothetical protein [Verrucomicrobiaceae bacterium]